MDLGDHPPEAIFVRVEIFLLSHKELNFDGFLNIYELSSSQKMFSFTCKKRIFHSMNI